MRIGYSSGGGVAALPVADGELDVGAVSQALWRRKWLILIPTLAVAVGTWAFVNTLTPRYGSEARVLIDVHENVFLRPEADKTAPDRAALDDQAVASQVQVFLSRDLARDIIAKLKLADRPEFDSALGGVSPITSLLAFLGLVKDPMKMSKAERVLQAYYDRLNVFSVERSRVIAVDFQSSDPDLASAVANAVAEGYLAQQQQAKQDQARSASQWLSGEIETLRKKVTDAEAKAAQYRAKSNLFIGGPNNTSLANQQLTDLNTQVAAARAQKADAEARSQLIRGILKSGRPIEANDVVDSDLIKRLAEQRGTLMAQLAEQSSTLLGQHPRIKELRAQIADLNTQIRDEAARRVRALENEVRIAGARVDSLQASLNQLKGQATTSNEADVQLRALERDAKSQRDLLESYLAKFREATARDSINAAPADARIISRATVSNIPVFPKRMPVVIVATMLTLMLGVGFTATRELLSPQNFRPMGAPANGYGNLRQFAPAMPYRPSAGAAALPGSRPALPVPIEIIEELARDLRTAGEAGGRVTVFGATRGVGTSLTAITLARALNRDARVILIDLALDAPNLAAISTDPKAPGIVDLISGKATAAEVIMKDQLSAVHLISAGKRSKDPAAILASPRLAVTIEALTQAYDHVIIDAGTVSEISAERFAALAPTGVLVVADPSHRNTETARERLHAAGFADVAVVVATG